MSHGYTEHELRGMFTEDEIAYGLPGIIFGDYDDYQEEDEYKDAEFDIRNNLVEGNKKYEEVLEKIIEELYQKIEKNGFNAQYVVDSYNKYLIETNQKTIRNNFLIDLDKKISAIKKLNKDFSHDEIFYIIYKMNVMDDKDNILNRYFNKERLPKDYYFLVQNKGALNILLSRLFTKLLGELNVNIQKKIEDICELIYINELLRTPYSRVGDIQKIIHEVVDHELGYEFHKQLDKEVIRVFLSICRLHINFYDFKYRDYIYFNNIEEKCYHESILWLEGIKEKKLTQKLTVYEYLRGIYLMPISYYRTIKSREHNDLIEFASKLKNIDLNQYQEIMIEIYSIKYRERYI